MLKKTGQMGNLHGSEFVCTEEGVQQQKNERSERKHIYRLEAASYRKAKIFYGRLLAWPSFQKKITVWASKPFTKSHIHREQNERSSSDDVFPPEILTPPCEIPTSRAITMHLGERRLFIKWKVLLHSIFIEEKHYWSVKAKTQMLQSVSKPISAADWRWHKKKREKKMRRFTSHLAL